MKANEKAKELVGYYFNEVSDANPLENILVAAKQCALICVAEMIKELNGFGNDDGYQLSRLDYWIEVKQEVKSIAIL